MEDKCFKTHSELIEILKNRGMDFSDADQEKKAISILEKENYYNVINGYKDLFLQKGTNTETYKNGTTFEEVYALYMFDRNIRHIYLKYLLKAENSFKTVIAHVFSDLYGHDNYLKITNFETQVNNVSDEDSIREITKLIGDIQQEIARQMKNHHPIIIHYMVNYGYIPLWVLVNVLTFGKITVFYKHMKKPDKEKVARKFRLQDKELHKYMDILSLARNKCAHDERFFDTKFKKGIHTKSIQNFYILNLPKDQSGYHAGINDIYAVAIMLALILGKNDANQLCAEIKNEFTILENELSTISIEDVKREMGFVGDWEKLTDL